MEIKNINTKNAQISLFIVIGAVILIIGVVYFIFTQTSLFLSPQAQSQEQISEILEFCVSEQLDNAIGVLQFKGGKLNLETYETQQRVDSLGFDIYSWSLVPEISDMEEELKIEVEETSINCIVENLRGLNEIYEITGFSEDKLSIDIKIIEAEVQAIIDLPLNIRLRGSDEAWEYSSLQIEVPTALYSNFKLAQAIHYEHVRNQIFENLVLEQISMAKDYSNPQESVPTQGVEFSCSTPIWRTSEVQNTILNLNEHNFRFLYFNGTRNIDSRFLGFDESIKEYYETIYTKNLTILDSNIDISSKKVEVIVPKQIQSINQGSQINTFRTFKVNGEDTEFIKPEQVKISGLIPIPCMSVFSKVYDLDYDIVVEIESYQNGEFEVFRVPIRIQIEENMPKHSQSSNQELLSQEFSIRNSQIMCEEENDKRVDIFINEISSQGLTPLFGADVSYSCAGIECSNLGPQTTQLTNNQAIVEAQVPFCSNARISVDKEGYLHLNTEKKAEELGFSQCENSRIELIDDIQTSIPYLDTCLIKLQEIALQPSLIRFFDVNRGTTITNPRGEVVVIVENEVLDYTSVATFDYETQEEISLQLPAVESYNTNITVMYYEDDVLLSYNLFENEEINPLFNSQISMTLPLLGNGMNTDEDFERIKTIYEEGKFLDVTVGLDFN